MTDTLAHDHDLDEVAPSHQNRVGAFFHSINDLSRRAKIALGVVAVTAFFFLCLGASSLVTPTSATISSATASVAADGSDSLKAAIVNGVTPTTNELAERMNNAVVELSKRLKAVEAESKTKAVIDYDKVGKSAAEEIKKSLPAMAPMSALEETNKKVSTVESRLTVALAAFDKFTTMSASAQEGPKALPVTTSVDSRYALYVANCKGVKSIDPSNQEADTLNLKALSDIGFTDILTQCKAKGSVQVSASTEHATPPVSASQEVSLPPAPSTIPMQVVQAGCIPGSVFVSSYGRCLRK